ncbi:MAG: LysE family translocator [Psychromonas sp.]
MDMHTLILFIIAALSINLIPGPDVVYIVTNTMKGNIKSGVQAALGLGTGYLVHTFAAVIGLSALIASSALLFSAIKYLGAAYLLYLGIRALINCYLQQSAFTISLHEDELPQHIFKQGVIVSILNPKVAMFFLAFLPQFIQPHSLNPTQELFILGLIFSVLATTCNLVYASIGGVLFSTAKSKNYSRVLEGVSGCMLIGLSAKIALTRA